MPVRQLGASQHIQARAKQARPTFGMDQDLRTQAERVLHCLLIQPLVMRCGHPAQPAPHHRERPAQQCGDPPTAATCSPGRRRRPDNLNSIGTTYRERGRQQHLNAGTALASDTTRRDRSARLRTVRMRACPCRCRRAVQVGHDTGPVSKVL